MFLSVFHPVLHKVLWISASFVQACALEVFCILQKMRTPNWGRLICITEVSAQSHPCSHQREFTAYFDSEVLEKKLIIFLLFNPSSHIFLLKSWTENYHLNKLNTASSECQPTRDQELFLELWTIPHFHQRCMGKAICNWGLTLWASETRYIPVCSLKKKISKLTSLQFLKFSRNIQ